MNFVDWYNSESLKIWEEFASEKNLNLMPLLLGSYNTEAEILYIGMNPSFNQPWMDKFFQSDLCPVILKGSESNSLFRWNGIDFNHRIDKVKKWEYLANHGVYKNYFGKFDAFTKDCGLNEKSWAHLDLFLMRETQQKEAIKLVLGKNEELNSFGERQINFLLDSVNKNKHKFVVVFNAKASEIISQKIGNIKYEPKFKFNKKYFFFSSMLTGQRALDKFSVKRLAQEIRRCINS